MLKKLSALSLLNGLKEKGYLDNNSSKEILMDIEVYLDEKDGNP